MGWFRAQCDCSSEQVMAGVSNVPPSEIAFPNRKSLFRIPLYCTATSTVYGMGCRRARASWGCVDKGLRELSIKMKACLTREEHALLGS